MLIFGYVVILTSFDMTLCSSESGLRSVCVWVSNIPYSIGTNLIQHLRDLQSLFTNSNSCSTDSSYSMVKRSNNFHTHIIVNISILYRPPTPPKCRALMPLLFFYTSWLSDGLGHQRRYPQNPRLILVLFNLLNGFLASAQ